MANSCAWIVPHNVVFEQLKIYDILEGYEFEAVCTPDQIEIYKPGAAGYAFPPDQLMKKADALELMRRAHDVSVAFLDTMIADVPAGVDPQRAFDLFQRNFAHETEHYGQVKYLHNVFMRKQGA